MTDVNGKLEHGSAERDFPEAYADYQRKSWRGLAIQLSYMAVGGLLIFLQSHFTDGLILSLMMCLVLTCAGYVIGQLALIRWACPRCHNRFHERGDFFTMKNTRCLHCGLPLRACRWLAEEETTASPRRGERR